MLMLFSQSKWDNGRQMSPFVPVSSSLSFAKMQAPLESVEQQFLLPLLGEQMMQRLQQLADNPPEDDKLASQLTQTARRAVANLAFWLHFDALNLRISDQGFQRQGSADWQGAYKYQEDRLRKSFKNAGFNALDQLLDFIEEHIEAYPDYLTSPCYQDRSRAIVRSAREANQFVFINSSHIVFMRLKGEFRTVEEYDLCAVLGEKLYRLLRAWLSGKTDFPADECICTLEQLRLACADFVVKKAASRLMRQTGSLTERGLYFGSTESGSLGNDIEKPATDRQIGDRCALADLDAHRAEASLRCFLNNYMGAIVGERTVGPIRNNDNHAAFFAM